MKNWFKNLGKEKIQKILFFSVLVLLFAGFFISLQFLPSEETKVGGDPNIDTPLNVDEKNNEDDKNNDITVLNQPEKFVCPINVTYEVLATFFDETKSVNDLEKAVLSYDNTYISSNGLLLTSANDTQFNVVVTLSGKVEKIYESSLYGKTVVISHENGYISEYSNLGSVLVSENQPVTQGQIIATSGESLLSDNKNNVYFVISKDGEALDPQTMFGKSVK